MKKFFQKFTLAIPVNGTAQLSEPLRSDFSNIDAVFITPLSGDVADLTLGLKVGGNEILPDGCDVSLLTFNGQYPVKDAAYSFAEDAVPARSAQLEVRVTNANTAAPAEINVYCILSNK